MRMFDPPYPGTVLRDYFDKVSITAAHQLSQFVLQSLLIPIKTCYVRRRTDCLFRKA